MNIDLPSAICAYFYLLTVIVVIITDYVHYMHMFQLNSYKASSQVKWLSKNTSIKGLGAVLSVLILAVFGAVWYGYLGAGLLTLFFLVPFKKKKPVKKKLVFTPRVIRMCVTSLVIYAAIFSLILILGIEKTLVIWFVLGLILITQFMVIIANFMNKPIEKAVNNHYINDAKRIINELPNLTVFGITGSYGKTSTKYYLNALLSTEFNVLMTPESYNTTMGVVKTIRGSLNATHEIFICEMGAKDVGEIKEICDIVKPKHSMITSIGPQHLESFKSIENIIKTKFEIAYCISDGIVFLNFDNPYIRENKITKKFISYGISDENKKYLNYYADSISVSEKGTCFFVTAPDGQRVSFETRLIGEHNVQNIVGAIAAAHFLGVSFEKLVRAVKRLESVPHRLQMIDGKSKLIIDDAFNSNPSGARAALDVLARINGVKILVTPGMVELGEKEYELNMELGSYAAEVCDYAVLIGENRAKPIKEGLLKSGFGAEKIMVYDTLQEGLAFVDALDTGDVKKVVLLENDLPDNY